MSAEYAKGYAAGRRRKTKDAQVEIERKKRDAFWQRAFLAALPSALLAQNWECAGKPITTLNERVKLAKDAADFALNAVAGHL